MTGQIESPEKSYKSTPSSRSSVLERARAYTQKMEGESQKRDSSRDRSARSPSAERYNANGMSMRDRAYASVEKEQQRAMPVQQAPPMASPARSLRSKSDRGGGNNQEYGGEQTPVVSPELLVEALSGHEDGLLAIAERLMEHYDHGYDAMGEAIIDAFADVQKLFQHVVEAAHMEGAAFEASRREEEMRDTNMNGDASYVPKEEPMSPNGPVRHDEFIDQDVKDCLTDAIRKGTALKNDESYIQCYQLYEDACQAASALLPVDSDHRGRLQLSLARAESMSPDRACAILRYAMDDVIRSAMRAHKTALPDPSKRADVVLSKPTGHPSTTGSMQVVQSSEEALNSLVAELQEIMEAPIYNDTPLQDVSGRFFDALQESRKQQSRKQQLLEQNLAKLKGDFLLARAEWEEKLTNAQGQGQGRKTSSKDISTIMDDARSITQNLHTKSLQEEAAGSNYNPNRFDLQNLAKHPKVESVVSMGNALGQNAKSLVGSFACGTQMDDNYDVANNATQAWRDRRSNNGDITVDRSKYERYDDGYRNGSGQSYRQSSSSRRRDY